MLQQAVGHKAGRDEVGGRSKRFQLGGGFTAYRSDLQVAGPPCQGAADAAQPLLHGLNAVATGKNQPVEIIELGQGIVEGAPFIRWRHHQGRQVDHRGASGFKQAPSFA